MRGVFFVKKVENGVFCKKVNLSPAQGALCTVSVFLFYILLIWGVRTHPTHPLPTGLVSWGGDSQPLPTTYGVWESAGAGAEHRPLKGFLAFYRGVAWLLLELIGRQVRGDGPFAPSPP